MTTETIERKRIDEILADIIGFARRCEDLILAAHQKPAVGMVAYASLIAQRRLAEAIVLLGRQGSYESRILLRSMLEHYFNLLWIRVAAPTQRANRFLKFHVVERLRMLDEILTDDRTASFAKDRSALARKRARYRHLFRNRRDGKLKWDRDWSGGMSFEARVREINAAKRKPADSIDTFSYALYRWFSAPTHGSAQHLLSLVERTRRGGRPRVQPDTHPNATLTGAGALLLGNLVQASQVFGFSNSMKSELSALKDRFADLLG